MKKYIKCLLCIAVIITTSTVTAYATAGSSKAASGGIFDALNDVNSKGSYLEYRDNYYLDMEDTSFLSSPGAAVFNMAANGIFGLSKNIGSLTAVATRFAMNTDIYDLVSDFISPFFKSMRDIVFDSYATYFIAAAAFYFMIQLLRNRHSQVIGGLIAVTVIIAVGLFYYAQPMFILSTLNNVTTELSSTVMDAPYKTLTNGKVDSASAGDKSVVLIWNVMVHSQWQYLEFGDISKAKTHEKAILTEEPESDERVDYVEDIDGKGLLKGNSASQIERLGLSLLFLVFNILLLIIILGFSVLILGYQFFVLFLALLGTFVFVLALIPKYGIGVLKRWSAKILASAAVKILLVFFLAILFIIMNFLYAATTKFGLLPVLFMMVSMCIIVAVKRKEIGEVFLGTPGGRVIKGAGDMASGAYSDLSGLKEKLSDLRRGQEQEMEDENDDERTSREERNANANTYLSEAELRKYHRANNGQGGTPSNMSNGSHSANNEQRADDGAGTSTSRNFHGEEINNDDFRHAEEILDRNYNLSKEKSDRLAEQTGEDAKYSDFVQRTDAVRDLGGARFDDRDILKTARILKRTEAAGGNMEDLIGDPEDQNSGGDQEEIRPQSCMDYMDETSVPESERAQPASVISGVKESAEDRVVNAESRENVTEPVISQPDIALSSGVPGESQNERTQKGLSFFKGNFGEDKGEKCYEKMCTKYGEEVVSQYSNDGRLSFSEVNQALKSSTKTVQDKET